MNNEPAFPTDSAAQVGPQTWHYEGLTKLEYFAGLAMQAQVNALVSFAYTMKSPTTTQREWLKVEMDDLPRASVNTAKALLAALEKESNAQG